jgi:DNA-binding protein H-NS
VTEQILDFLLREFGPFALGVLIMIWFLRETQKSLSRAWEELEQERKLHQETREQAAAARTARNAQIEELQNARIKELRQLTELISTFNLLNQTRGKGS